VILFDMMSASLALDMPRRWTKPIEAFPSVTRPSEEKGVRRKVCGAAYMKSENEIRAADRPTAGPFSAVTRILGCV
jgi:hypothetical protein